MVVVVLDGVFGGHDVTLVVHVDEVEHGRQGCGFPRPRGASNDKEASGTPDEIFADVGEANLVKRQQAVGNQTKHQREVPPLAEDRHAETGLVAVREAEVSATLFLNFLLVSFGSDLLHQGHGVISIENLGVKILEAAMETESRLSAHRKVKVGSIEFDHSVKQTVDLDGGHKWLSVK